MCKKQTQTNKQAHAKHNNIKTKQTNHDNKHNNDDYLNTKSTTIYIYIYQNNNT